MLFLATSIAASRGIAPVKQLIQAASGISEANINIRLPLPENKDEIYQLATTINELLHRVESGLQREKQFTADASHEIRTPLTAIRGTLEVLLRKQREPAQYEEKINRVIGEVDRLDAMLDQLLQLARLESDHIPVQSYPSCSLDAFSCLLPKSGNLVCRKKIWTCGFKYRPAAILSTDAALLNIVLDNLPRQCHKIRQCQVDLLIAPGSPERVGYADDSGQRPGHSAEHLPYLFDRFYRADDARNAAVPGAGLGLSMAKKLADLLGIQLSVSSRVGKGPHLCWILTEIFFKPIFRIAQGRFKVHTATFVLSKTSSQQKIRQ